MSSDIQEHVTNTITRDTVGRARQDFGIAMILSCNASFPERLRAYTNLAGVEDDGFATTSPEYLAVQAAFAQRPKPAQVFIGRAVGKPTLAYRIDVSSVVQGASYEIEVEGEGITAGSFSYEPPADITFTAEADDELATSVAHGMVSGEGPYRVSNTGGALPTGLAADTNYWIHVPTSAVDTFSFATSEANALAGTVIDMTTDGTGTHTLRRCQNDVICAQIVDQLNAIVGNNYVAAQVTGSGETDYVTVTGDAAGDWFSLKVNDVSYLKIAMTHAEPATTLATDLNAIKQENDSWYMLYTLYNSDAYVKAAAAWIETERKMYVADLSASETATLAAGGGDTADDLHDLAYERTAVMYHPSPADMAGMAWIGRCISLPVGKVTWKFKRLSGVSTVPTTPTHRTNIRAKKANTYQLLGSGGQTWEGMTVDGHFVDTERGIDWLDDDMTARVFDLLSNNEIVPFTNAGRNQILGEVRASLDEGVERGILREGTTEVTAPLVEEVDDADKENRTFPDIMYSAEFAGAVHKVNLLGNITV